MNRTTHCLLVIGCTALPFVVLADAPRVPAVTAAPATGAPAPAPATPAGPAASATPAPTPAATRPGPAIPPVPTAPTPEFDKLKFLVGAFNCDVDAALRAGAPTLPPHAKGRFTGKLDLGGFFVAFQYAEAKTKERPTPFASSGFLGWDPGLRRYVFAQADSLGIAFLLRADVPPVDQYVFKGTATAAWGRHLPAVWTITRTVKGFDVLAEGTDIEGQVSRIATLTCLKAGK